MESENNWEVEFEKLVIINAILKYIDKYINKSLYKTLNLTRELKWV